MDEARQESVAQGVRKLESLLKGEPQRKSVRSFLGLEAEGSYPSTEEFPRFLSLPSEIGSRLADITMRTLRDDKEREIYVGEKRGKYVFSKTHIGDNNSVKYEHRIEFPKEDLGTILLEAHTHPEVPEGQISTVSARDITTLMREYHVPGLMVSHDKGVWLFLKTADFFGGHDYRRIVDNDEEIYRGFSEIADLYSNRSIDLYLQSAVLTANKLNMAFYYHLEHSPKSHVDELTEGNYILTRGDSKI